MKKTLGIFIPLTLASILFWFFNPAKGKNVEVVSPQRSPAVQAVYATGTVEASLMIPIAPKISGRLSSLDADEGERVEAGQLLASLESADAKESVNELQARADLALRELERAQKLAKTGAISKEALDQARAAHKAANASLERSKAELGYLKLFAPQAGTIIRRDGEIGEMMTAGTTVFWMSGGDDLRIETEVDEEDIRLVQPGQKVVVAADAFPQQIYKGEVDSITPKGDPVARSYRVRVSLEPGTPLMIGMTAETNIITHEKDDALMIPASAVSKGKIIRINGSQAEIVPVTTGIKTPGAVEITEGIESEDQIAKIFDASILEHSHISAKVREWTPQASAP